MRIDAPGWGTGRTGFWVGAMMLGLWAGWAVAQTAGLGVVKGGFSIPVSDEKGGIRTLITGKEMHPLKDGRMRISGFRMTNREPALVVEAPECLLVPGTYAASSAGPIRVQAADGRFELTGEGFSWAAGATRLVVSNKVVTLLRGQGTNDVRRVSAGTFEIDVRTGKARYERGVEMVDPGWMLRAGDLDLTVLGSGEGLKEADASGGVSLEVAGPGRKARATGERARYRLVDGGQRLSFEGAPAWEAAPYRGRSDQLTLIPVSTNIVVIAEGNAVVELPRAASGRGSGGPADSAMIRATSDRYRYEGNSVEFDGNVKVEDPDRGLTCRTMKVALGSARGEIESLTAVGEVAMRLRRGTNDMRVTAGEAVYAIAPAGETLELSGEPAWVHPPYSGRAEAVRVQASEGQFEVKASGQASVRFPAALLGKVDLLSSGPVSAPGGAAVEAGRGKAAEPVEIRCDRYVIGTERAVFEGGVVVEPIPGRLSAGRLETGFDRKTGKIRSLLAEGDAVVTQGDVRLRANRIEGESEEAGGDLSRFAGVGEVRIGIRKGSDNTSASGGRATFRAGSGLVELTENPELTTEKGVKVRGARLLLWDVFKHKFSAEGRFDVSGPAETLRQVAPRGEGTSDRR